MPAPLRDVPQEGIELIKSFEGIPDGDPSTVNLDAYLDPVGIWTIGWGHAITHQGTLLCGPQNKGIARALYPGGITLAQAEMLLRGELVNFARDVLRLVKVPLDDGAFAALVSFAFNCGSANLGASTLLRKLNAGDAAGAADEFLRWNKARKNGALVELPGLTRRRRAERALFLGEDWRAVAATRTRGAAALRTLAPERPEPPEEPAEAVPVAIAAKKRKRAPEAKIAAAKTTVAATAPPAADKPAAAKKAAAVTTPAAKKAATPRARTTTPKAPPKAPRARRPAPRTGR
jgi:lysozyme